MSVNDVTLAAVKGQKAGQPVVITLAYRTQLSVGPKEQELLGLAQAIEEVFFNKTITSDLLDFCSPNVTFQSISLRDSVDPSIGLDYGLSPQPVGTLNGDWLANDQCMLVQKRTSRIGGRYTGSNYLPVGSEDVLTLGLWGAAFADSLIIWCMLRRAIAGPTLLNAFVEVVWSKTYSISTEVERYTYISEPRRQNRRRRI